MSAAPPAPPSLGAPCPECGNTLMRDCVDAFRVSQILDNANAFALVLELYAAEAGNG